MPYIPTWKPGDRVEFRHARPGSFVGTVQPHEPGEPPDEVPVVWDLDKIRVLQPPTALREPHTVEELPAAVARYEAKAQRRRP